MITENLANQTEKNFRGNIGFLLRDNKITIAAAILLVFLLNRIDFIFPQLRILGIPLTLLLVWGISWLKRTGWSDLGVFRPASWAKTILIGICTAILLQSMALLQIRLGGPTPDLVSFEQIKGNIWVFLGFLVISWTTAGFGEELVWRGFMMKQIARIFNEKKIGWWTGLILSSVGFGLIHAYQGFTGILMSGAAGFIYGLILLASGRNLWTSIIAHACTDTLGFLLIYYWDVISKIIGV